MRENPSILVDDVRSLRISPARHATYSSLLRFPRQLYFEQDKEYPNLRQTKTGELVFGEKFRLPDAYRDEIDEHHRKETERELREPADSKPEILTIPYPVISYTHGRRTAAAGLIPIMALLLNGCDPPQPTGPEIKFSGPSKVNRETLATYTVSFENLGRGYSAVIVAIPKNSGAKIDQDKVAIQKRDIKGRLADLGAKNYNSALQFLQVPEEARELVEGQIDRAEKGIADLRKALKDLGNIEIPSDEEKIRALVKEDIPLAMLDRKSTETTGLYVFDPNKGLEASGFFAVEVSVPVEFSDKSLQMVAYGFSSGKSSFEEYGIDVSVPRRVTIPRDGPEKPQVSGRQKGSDRRRQETPDKNRYTESAPTQDDTKNQEDVIAKLRQRLQQEIEKLEVVKRMQET